jgi:hypothetical protein
MRRPNIELRDLLREAKWSGAAFAMEVNRVGADSGLLLRYDRSAVAHWLSGMRPLAPVPGVVAEVFSRRLDRIVSVADTGLVEAHSGGPGAPGFGLGDVVEELRDLASGAGRRQVLAGAYSLAALALPVWGGPLPARLLVDPGTSRRVGREDVVAARRMLELCSRLDAMCGGGAVRTALAQYLVSPLSGWLRAPASPAVRRAMFEVAAGLTYLCAFVHFDDGKQVLAQRYYTISLDLAREAGDRRSYALALRGLSVQARLLGHQAQALSLAQAALDSAGTALPGHSRAFLHGQAAVAAAAAGNPRQAASELLVAERALGRERGSLGAVGVYHPASLARQRAAVVSCEGDRDAAGAAIRMSLQWRPPGEQRSHALDLAELAELELSSGRLELACDLWSLFLERYPQLDSGRADLALRSVLSRTLPHQRNGQVALLREQTTSLAVQRRRSR